MTVHPQWEMGNHSDLSPRDPSRPSWWPRPGTPRMAPAWRGRPATHPHPPWSISFVPRYLGLWGREGGQEEERVLSGVHTSHSTSGQVKRIPLPPSNLSRLARLLHLSPLFLPAPLSFSLALPSVPHGGSACEAVSQGHPWEGDLGLSLEPHSSLMSYMSLRPFYRWRCRG